MVAMKFLAWGRKIIARLTRSNVIKSLDQMWFAINMSVFSTLKVAPLRNMSQIVIYLNPGTYIK